MAVRDSYVLSDPTIVINNLPIAIKPNSVSYTEGFGEMQVRVQSAGGGATQSVYAQDVSTRLSMIKFAMESTETNIGLVRTWKSNSSQGILNTIRIVDRATGFTRSFQSAVIENEPEIALGVDSEISLEWKGDPAV